VEGGKRVVRSARMDTTDKPWCDDLNFNFCTYFVMPRLVRGIHGALATARNGMPGGRRSV
jgi:hypothetical protein